MGFGREISACVQVRRGARDKRLDKSGRFLFEWRAFIASAHALGVCGVDESRQMPPSTDPFYAGLGQALRVGTEVLASPIVGGGLGWVADTYLLNSSPWGMVVGLVLGVAAGVRSAYRAAQRWST